MADIKVLIEGYAKEEKDGWLASSTTTLIQDRDRKIIVDPGINRKLLLAKLKKEKLAVKDIDVVFMTHYHPDHNFLSGIFPNAIAMDDELIYDNDKEIEHEGIIPGTKIKIISTPGHEIFHGSLVVETKKGTVVVCGDVFWWSDEEEQITTENKLLNHKDPFTKDAKKLLESRKEVLKIADWIIPGHGKMFKNSLK